MMAIYENPVSMFCFGISTGIVFIIILNRFFERKKWLNVKQIIEGLEVETIELKWEINGQVKTGEIIDCLYKELEVETIELKWAINGQVKTWEMRECLGDELQWCENNPDKKLSKDCQKGFKNGIKQSIEILVKLHKEKEKEL